MADARGRPTRSGGDRGSFSERIVVTKQQIQTALNPLRREVADELAYLLEGLFSNIEVRFFEIAGQRADRERELSKTIRELLSRREEITLAFASAVKRSMDNWPCVEKETIEASGDDPVVAEAAYSVEAHFVEVLGQIDRRSRELVGNAGNLERLPVTPEPLCHCFVATCRDMCDEEISLHITAALFRRLVLERLGDLYGRIGRKLKIAADVGDKPYSRPHHHCSQEEIVELESKGTPQLVSPASLTL